MVSIFFQNCLFSLLQQQNQFAIQLIAEYQAQSDHSFYQQVMNYEQTIDFLFNSLPVYQREGKTAYKATLDNTLALDTFLDHPHRAFKTIHIAGTNGKGSSSHMLASILQASGYKVGLYTSPHLLDFRERIKVNGKEVDQAFVIRFVERISPKIKELTPSFFEMTVGMAFQYFFESNVDVAIIETGLGGRLDSTNIITPLVSLITNIGLDHTQFLGHTLAAIAKEKAGIIKPNIPVIVGERNKETASVFTNSAKKNHSKLLFADDHYTLIKQSISHETQHLLLEKNKILQEYTIDMLGNYQALNVMGVLTCIDELKPVFPNIDQLSIAKGLNNVKANTGLCGRWQTIRKNPLVICDTAHNAEGVRFIAKQLKDSPHQQLHIVWGMVNDKSLDAVLKLLPSTARYYFTQASIPRAKKAEELKAKATSYNLEGAVYPDVPSAYAKALSSAEKEDLIFVGGSTFIVADLLLYCTSHCL